MASSSESTCKSVSEKMWVLIDWFVENKYSVQRQDCVTDKAMLTDPSRCGVVKYAGDGPEPTCGWKEFPAKIVAVHGMYR